MNCCYATGIMEPPACRSKNTQGGQTFRVQIPLCVCVVALPRPEICDASSVSPPAVMYLLAGSPAVWHLLDRQSYLTAIFRAFCVRRYFGGGGMAVWRARAK